MRQYEPCIQIKKIIIRIKRKEKDKKKIKVRKEGTYKERQRGVRESDFRERSSSFSLRFTKISP